MNENVIDVLIYLYENYLDNPEDAAPDHILLQEELMQAGFPNPEIQKAFQWLDELTEQQIVQREQARATHSFRVYTEDEQRRLDSDAQGLLLFLEQNGILDARSRELVLDRAMALDTDALSVEDLKWIVLLVLINQPGSESAHALMADLVFEGPSTFIH